MSSGFTVQATLTRVASMRDGGLSIGFSTQELSADEKVKVMSHHNQFGWLLFGETERVMPAAPVDNRGSSPSQRLRRALWNYYRTKKVKKPFELYYREYVDNLIERLGV